MIERSRYPAPTNDVLEETDHLEDASDVLSEPAGGSGQRGETASKPTRQRSIGEAMTSDRHDNRLGTADALRLLANEERRQLLRELFDRDDGPILYDEALEVLSEDVVEQSATNGGGVDRERLAINLHHNHLPRLAEKDIIVWDDESDAISTGPAFEDLRPYVEWTKEEGEEIS